MNIHQTKKLTNTVAQIVGISSMTGFGSAQQELVNVAGQVLTLNVELRSVNSRFLDLTFKIPEELNSQEMKFRSHITTLLKRGKVEVKIQLHSLSNQQVTQPSIALLQQLNGVQNYVHSWLPTAQPLSVSEVLEFVHGNTKVSFDYTAAAFEVLSKAAQQLLQSRQKEGLRLKQILLDSIEQLFALAKQAEPLVPQLVELQKQKFLQRWQQALQQVPSANSIPEEMARDRALVEATAFAIRIDVAEELTRLQSHLKEIVQLLDSQQAVGKRLDFMIQELHREANTLGSKSALLELSKISVDMKVLIEQMREQVQNIE